MEIIMLCMIQHSEIQPPKKWRETFIKTDIYNAQPPLQWRETYGHGGDTHRTSGKHIESEAPPDQVLGSRTQGHYTNDPSLGVVLCKLHDYNNRKNINVPNARGLGPIPCAMEMDLQNVTEARNSFMSCNII